MEKSVIHVVVDKIDEGMAMVESEDGLRSFYFPHKWLPEGTTEGSWLDISISINDSLTEQKKNENKALLDKIISKNK